VVDTLKYQFTCIGFVMGIMAIALTAVLTKFITKPFLKMNEAAKHLAEGKYDIDFSGKGYREINELGDSLNYASTELAKTDKPIVLLISAGRPIIVEEFKNRANAIVYVWQLGTEAGNAIADVVSGECDVTGRLSVSVPFSEGQLPVFYNRTNTGRPALGKVWYETGYIDSTAHASYPFGYGKSYTEFCYSDLTLSSNKMGIDGEITVSLKIKNVGSRKGSTVAQLYIRDLFASRVRPIMELKGFEKLELEAGEEKLVSLKLAANSLGFHDEELNYIVEKGDFKLWVGENCRDQKLITDFKIC
jgi:beta-glucosidase